jgi:DNA primase
VVQLPEGQDADGLLCSQGPTAIEGLIAGGQHWLEWRLDRLLAPLSESTGEASLETLQAVECDGQALVEQLPEGVLRRSAEQRLDAALRGRGEQCIDTFPPAVAVVEPFAAIARRRAERRALRLFVHAAECRSLLQCLTLQDPACRAAMEWLGSLAVVALDDSIAGVAFELAGRLQGVVGAELSQAAAPAPEVIRVLQREPQAELQALLDWLEPVAISTAE